MQKLDELSSAVRFGRSVSERQMEASYRSSLLWLPALFYV